MNADRPKLKHQATRQLNSEENAVSSVGKNRSTQLLEASEFAQSSGKRSLEPILGTIGKM
jgi:hypothetical protein